MKNKFLLVFFASLFFAQSHASVVINEVMVKNVSAVVNDDFNYVGWVELHNTGNDSADVSNYYFSDEKNDAFKWEIKAGGRLIAPNGFAVFYFDELDKDFHANFKLDADGGVIYLIDNQGNVSDEVKYPAPFRNASYGRLTDGSGEFATLSASSPNATNAGASACSSQAAKPVFSVQSGFYKSELSVSIMSETTGAKIYYSTDGSEPSADKSALYEGEIKISKTTPLRAIAVTEGTVPSEIATASYFINSREVKLPVVSIVSDSLHLYDEELGMLVAGVNGSEVPSGCNGPDSYANYWNDWDRAANFEFFNMDKEPMINQEVKIGNFGACSRTKFVKSIKVNTSKVFGNNKINCPFFPEKPNLKCKSVVLRNSGNDFGRSYLRDAFMQSLLIDRVDIDHQAYQPSVVFINGNYYGMLNIRERSNKDFIYANHGLDEDEFVIVEGSGTYKDEDGNTAYNDETYGELVEILNSDSVNTDAAFERINELVDIDETLNYFMAQIYYANTDWPGGNIKCWRKNDGGKFRYILYDTDFGYSLYGANYSTNGFSQASKNPVFAGLMKNDAIKSILANKFVVHLASTFETDRAISLLEEMADAIEPEALIYADYLSKNHKIEQGWEKDILNMESFAQNRPKNIYSQMSSFFGLGKQVKVDMSSNIENAKFRLNKEACALDLASFSDFVNRGVDFETLPVEGYLFKQWEVISEKKLFGNNEYWNYCDETGVDTATWKGKDGASKWENVQAVIGYSGTNTNKDKLNTDLTREKMANSITTYFNKVVNVENASNIKTVFFNLTYNDGAVVYVNGTEVHRVNMKTGDVYQTTPAMSDCFTSLKTSTFEVSGDVFINGENVIAVELHQKKPNTSGMFFDMSANFTEIEPEVEIVTNNILSIVLKGNTEIKAVFEKDENYKPAETPLYINEVCASNNVFADEAYEDEDWIEIYNASDKDINLGGLFISDDLTNLRKFRIADSVPALTTVPARGYISLWADKETEQGVTHLGFELPKGRSQTIVLSKEVDGNLVTIDSVSYLPHENGESFARVSYYPESIWDITSKPTFAKENRFPLTDVEKLVSETTSVLAYINPATEELFIVNAENGSPFWIVEGNGKVVSSGTWNGDGIDISKVSKGLFVLVINNGGQNVGIKLIKR